MPIDLNISKPRIIGAKLEIVQVCLLDFSDCRWFWFSCELCRVDGRAGSDDGGTTVRMHLKWFCWGGHLAIEIEIWTCLVLSKSHIFFCSICLKEFSQLNIWKADLRCNSNVKIGSLTLQCNIATDVGVHVSCLNCLASKSGYFRRWFRCNLRKSCCCHGCCRAEGHRSSELNDWLIQGDRVRNTRH